MWSQIVSHKKFWCNGKIDNSLLYVKTKVTNSYEIILMH
jgi:hypothetical protein